MSRITCVCKEMSVHLFELPCVLAISLRAFACLHIMMSEDFSRSLTQVTSTKTWGYASCDRDWWTNREITFTGRSEGWGGGEGNVYTKHTPPQVVTWTRRKRRRKNEEEKTEEEEEEETWKISLDYRSRGGRPIPSHISLSFNLQVPHF